MITLVMKATFMNPKTAPRSLFIIPRNAKLAAVVRNLPAREIRNTTIKNVIANATRFTNWMFQDTLWARKSLRMYEKYTATYIPRIKATNEASSAKNPRKKPRIIP